VLELTPYNLAQRFIGLQEIPGPNDAPFIQFCFSLCGYGPEEPDETPWCSAFVNGIAYICGAPRSRSAAARSWLEIGRFANLTIAAPGWDVVVLKRGRDPQPGPEVIKAQGHVGFFAGVQGTDVLVLGGNQDNAVNVRAFPMSRVLGYRRLGPLL
jgi:uncharacterized protein (TIGR02594 family)